MQSTIIWIPIDIYEESCREASEFYPKETGGALMGYWADQHRVVITAAIAAGPNAKYNRYSFEADHTWQLLNIEQRYRSSGRKETYIGDWHTHPGGISGRLSFEDKRSLRRVAASHSARAPNPLSIIYYGRPDYWQCDSWCAALRPRKVLWAQLVIWAADLRSYKQPRE